jgi:hypothetical protein
MSISAGDVYPTLPRHIRLKIDDAFQDFSEVVSDAESAPVDSGGGFLVDEPQGEKRLTLIAVPNALDRLGLAGLVVDRDGEVMAVFRQASSGWDDTQDSAAQDSSGSLGLDDWRSVCAVLLEHHAEEYQESDGSNLGDEDVYMADPDEVEQPDYDDGDSDDEYIDDRPRVRRTRNTRSKARRHSDSSLSSLPDEEDIERVRQVCENAFALFLPEVPPELLLQQRIMMKDIQRVAKLLGEKISAEEVGI